MRRNVAQRRSKLLKTRATIMNVAVGLSMASGTTVLLSTQVEAQSFYGSVVGTVTDRTGAVVPGATVTLTNTGTNEKHTAQSNQAGEYSFVSLVPATYRIDVEAPSFEHLVEDGVVVQVGAAARADAALSVGNSSETVQVTSSAPMMQTESGTLSTEITGKQVQEMPINGRNPLNLIALSTGVVPEGSSQGTAANNDGGHTNPLGWGNYQIGGAIAGESVEFMDGGPLNDLGNATALVPTQDAIQEFRVATSAVNAEFGRFGGGVVELTTKSGANDFHGSAYEYLRNNVFNANDFFSKAAGDTRQKWNQNQFGGVLSGPIKKEKAFFLFTGEGFRALLASPSPTNVPTQELQNGVFVGQHLTDPTGRCAIAYDAGTNTSTIPTSCIDPTAAVIKNYWPLPNDLANAANNYFAAPTSGNNSYQYNGRVDYTVSEKQRVFGRYTYWNLADISPNEFNNAGGFATSNAASSNVTHTAVIGDTYAFNASTILDVRASYLRQFFQNAPLSTGVDLSQFGPAYAALASQVSVSSNPTPTLNGAYNLYGFAPMDNYSKDWWDNYSLSGGLTKIMGKHSIKVGGEARLMDRSSTGTVTNSSGDFVFNNTTFTGNEWANFLLGYAASGSITTLQTTAAYNWYQGYYAQDTWRATQNLTLNYGVRWELPGAIAERNNKATVLLPNTPDATANTALTLALTNSAAYASRTTEPSKHGLFSPRVGFAERLDDKTELRGGFLLAYLSPDLPTYIFPAYSPINDAQTSFTNTTTPTFTLANPFPNGILQPTGRANADPTSSFLGQILDSPVPTSKFPYTEQWNLSFSRQFASDFVTDITYAGASESQLPLTYGVDYDLNELSSQYYALGAALLNPVTAGSTETVGQSLRPYPQFQDVNNSAQYGGHSAYNSLQVQGRKQFKTGGQLTLGYTWSKLIGNSDSLSGNLDPNPNRLGSIGRIQDFNNIRGERSLLSFDTPHRFVASYVLDLPFGKGRSFAHYNGVAGSLVSGWSVNGITTFQSGNGVNMTMNGNYLTTNFGGGTLRPNYVQGCEKQIHGPAATRLNEWFNTACFVSPGQFAFGDEPRVDPQLRAAGIANWDFAAVKTTQIRDTWNVQIRGEFFNLFNHTQFGPPDSVLDGGDFGKVLTQANTPRLVQISLRLNF